MQDCKIEEYKRLYGRPLRGGCGGCGPLGGGCGGRGPSGGGCGEASGGGRGEALGGGRGGPIGVWHVIERWV